MATAGLSSYSGAVELRSSSARSKPSYFLASYSVSYPSLESYQFNHQYTNPDHHMFRSYPLVIPPCQTCSPFGHLVLRYKALRNLLRSDELYYWA
jgi:hypothetical protein